MSRTTIVMPMSVQSCCRRPAIWPVRPGSIFPVSWPYIAQGNHQEAWEVMREDNPFPWVCGMVCPHPCERACVRANLDQPINIRYLKAFAAEWVDKHGDFRSSHGQTGHREKSCGHWFGTGWLKLCLFPGPQGAPGDGFRSRRCSRRSCWWLPFRIIGWPAG